MRGLRHYSYCLLLVASCTSGNSSGEEHQATADAATPSVDAALMSDAMDVESDIVSNTNVDGCVVGAIVAPVLPDEAGHVAAGKLSPQRYPFAVGTIGYKLSVTSSCTATIDHRVDVYVTSSDSIEEEPTVVATFTVPASAEDSNNPFFVNELVLDSPIVLQSGEHLVVAVEQAADTTSRSTCLAACLGGTSGVNFWSNATQAPFAWTDLVDDHDFNVNYMVWARRAGS